MGNMGNIGIMGNMGIMGIMELWELWGLWELSEYCGDFLIFESLFPGRHARRGLFFLEMHSHGVLMAPTPPEAPKHRFSLGKQRISIRWQPGGSPAGRTSRPQQKTY